MLESTDKGALKEMIITAENGSIAIKDLGDDIALGVLAPESYKMGGLVIALKLFVKEMKAL
jgi:predicted regulator of Ras-like GTPase activity (Roadblock/LC7/MglB family)